MGNSGHIFRIVGSLKTRGGLGRNLIAMTIWQGANYLAPLLTFPHLARTLHPIGFGQYGIYLLVAGWMTIFSDWGTNYTGARLIAQKKASGNDISEAFWNIFFLRMLIVFGIFCAVVLYLVWMHANPEKIKLLLASWSIILGNAVTVSWCLQALERLDAFATASLVGRLFTVPATIIAVRNIDQVWVAVLIQGVGGILIGLTSVTILVRSKSISALRWSWSGIYHQLRHGAPVLVTTASHGLYSSTSTALLGFFGGNHPVGIFVAADRIRLAAQGATQPISQSFYPRISRLVITDRRRAVATIRNLALFQGMLMFFGCLLLVVFAPFIMRFVAGPRFVDSVDVLRILSFVVLVVAFNNVFGMQTLMPFGFTKTFGRASLFAALVNLCIMPPLVYFFGPRGAAAGVFCTEAFLLTYYVVAIFRNKILTYGMHEIAVGPIVKGDQEAILLEAEVGKL